MLINLIYGGLILIPFYEVIIKIMPYSTLTSFSGRSTKEILFFVFSFIIGILGLWYGLIKKVANNYILFFILFMIINYIYSPKIIIDSTGTETFWYWKPAMYIISVFLFFMTVANLEINNMNIKYILKICFYVSLFMSLMAFLQFFGFDQFWMLIPQKILGITESPKIVGNLGQPTILASFLAMNISIFIYLKKYLYSLILGIVLCLTKCKIAIFASLFSITLYGLLNNKYLLSLGIIIISSLLIYFYSLHTDNNSSILQANGRYQVWVQLIKDVKEGPLGDKKNYCLTGMGIGAYEYFNAKIHKNQWDKAHNEYLDLLYNGGFVGLGLFLLALGEMIKDCFFNIIRLADERRQELSAIFCGIIAISICAMYSFVWQLGVQIFYTVVFSGLVYNKYFFILRDKE